MKYSIHNTNLWITCLLYIPIPLRVWYWFSILFWGDEHFTQFSPPICLYCRCSWTSTWNLPPHDERRQVELHELRRNCLLHHLHAPAVAEKNGCFGMSFGFRDGFWHIHIMINSWMYRRCCESYLLLTYLHTYYNIHTITAYILYTHKYK